MTPAKRILLAAAASPLRLAGSWCRTDLPEGLPPQPVDADACWEAMDLELLEWQPRAHRMQHKQAWLTDAGLDEAETLRQVLGAETRRLLRRIDEAGELVRRERPSTEVEQLAIMAAGGIPTETLVEWVPPAREHGPGGSPWGGEGRAVCPGGALQGLADRGLVVLLAGGTRALLTGAGRWCAAEAPQSDSKPGADQGAPGGGSGDETAPKGCCGPSKAVSR